MTKLETVQEVTQKIKSQFKQLGYISIRGELSNVRMSKGHLWYELLHLDHPKDSSSQTIQKYKRDKIGGVIWSYDNNPALKDGDIVVIDANFQLFSGRYNLNTREIVLDQDYQELTLKKKYQELYQKYTPLFQATKKPLPTAIKYAGLVTGSGSDALHDVINISYRRDPTLSWVICPSLVQGETAPQQIISAVQTLVSLTPPPEVIVLARGGGSQEDLWTFNDPSLIEYLATVPIPLVTGIGHQMDVTLADHIADVRMSTPSSAAEKLTTPLVLRLNRLHDQITHYLSQCPELPPSPATPIQKAMGTLDYAKRMFTQANYMIIQQCKNLTDSIVDSTLLAPKPTPEGMCQITRFGRPVTCFERLHTGDRLRLHYVGKDGKYSSYQVKIVST